MVQPLARGLGPFASGKAEYDGDPLVPLGGLRQVYLEGAQKIRPNAAWGIGTQIYNIAMENPLYNYMVIEHSHGELGYFPEMALLKSFFLSVHLCISPNLVGNNHHVTAFICRRTQQHAWLMLVSAFFATFFAGYSSHVDGLKCPSSMD